jgi:hypothetical protein
MRGSGVRIPSAAPNHSSQQRALGQQLRRAVDLFQFERRDLSFRGISRGTRVITLCFQRSSSSAGSSRSFQACSMREVHQQLQRNFRVHFTELLCENPAATNHGGTAAAVVSPVTALIFRSYTLERSRGSSVSFHGDVAAPGKGDVVTPIEDCRSPRLPHARARGCGLKCGHGASQRPPHCGHRRRAGAGRFNRPSYLLL